MPTKGHGERLSRKREEAIAALLLHPTLAGAAAGIGVDETTLIRWLKRPAFASAYRRARRAVLDSAVGRLQAAAGKAVDCLVDLLTADNLNVRARAAEAILTHSFRGEAEDTREKVEELERILREIQAHEPNQQGGEATGPGPGVGNPPGAGTGG